MSKQTLAGGTSPFAHLLAGAAALGSRALGRRSAEEPDNEPEGENEDELKGEEPDNEPEGENEDEPKGKRRGRKAETDDDEDAEAKAEDDDDDEDMAQARREGFLAAQARGRRIFSAASAGKRPDMAAHFAFNDSMPSAQAIATLDMAAGGPAPSAPEGSRLGRRMARVVLPNPGASGAKPRGNEVDAFVAAAARAAEKAGIC